MRMNSPNNPDKSVTADDDQQIDSCSKIQSLPSLELPRLTGYTPCSSQIVIAQHCSNPPIGIAEITKEQLSKALKAPAVPQLTVPPCDSRKAISIDPHDFDNPEKTMECPMEFDEEGNISYKGNDEERVTVQELGIMDQNSKSEKCHPDSEQIYNVSDGLSYCADSSKDPHCDKLILNKRLCEEKEIMDNLARFLDDMSRDDSSLPCTRDLFSEGKEKETSSWNGLE